MNTNASDKFPDLKPIVKAPSLSSLNGVGFGILGARDHDAETQTYVKTHCLTFLFVPLLAIGAYRVAKADNGGLYFLGKEPISVVAKAFNALVLLVAVSALSYFIYQKTYNTPNAIADRQIAQAQKHLEDGKVVAGANLYRDVLYGDSDRTNAAQFKLSKLHENQFVTSADLADVAEVFRIELATREQSFGDPTGASVFESAIKLVEDRGAQDLPSANDLLETVKPVVSDPEKYHAARKKILEELIKSQSNNMQFASQLAESLEFSGNIERCVSLLEPHAKELGESEGARILGQIWAGEGKLDEAYELLSRYCETRLQKLNTAESRLNTIYDAEREKVIGGLERGDASEAFYRNYDNSNEEKQFVMIQQYIDDKLNDNRKFVEAQQSAYRDAIQEQVDLMAVDAEPTEDRFRKIPGTICNRHPGSYQTIKGHANR